MTFILKRKKIKKFQAIIRVIDVHVKTFQLYTMIATSFCKKFEHFKNLELYLCFFINENKTLKEVLISQLKQLKDRDFYIIIFDFGIKSKISEFD